MFEKKLGKHQELLKKFAKAGSPISGRCVLQLRRGNSICSTIIINSGILKEGEICFQKLFVIFDGIISKKMKSRGESNDLVDALFDIHQMNESELSICFCCWKPQVLVYRSCKTDCSI